MATLEQLANVKITELNNTISNIDSNITNCELLKNQATTLLNSIVTDTAPDITLKAVINNNIDGYTLQIGYLNGAKLKNQSVINNINTSLSTLSQDDKDLSALILQNYTINHSMFDFNVKSTFVSQVRSIYDNSNLDPLLKRQLIERLCSLYVSTNY